MGVCVRMMNGKIIITKDERGMDRNMIHLEDEEEGFFTGPYPEYNTMIMPFDRYQRLFLELKNNCPNMKNWRITAIVFIGMFTTLAIIHLHQWSFFQIILQRIRRRLLSRI
jgi:hypothetical protein